MKLFEEKPNKKVEKDKVKKNKSRAVFASNARKQPTLKDKKVKSALDIFVQKNLKSDNTVQNLAVLNQVSQQNKLPQDSLEKIFSYHWKKDRKIVEAPLPEKKETSVFTEEDFLKFEQEYFVKS